MRFRGARIYGRVWLGLIAVITAAACGVRTKAADPTLDQLAEENRQLRAQLDAQQKIIAELKARMDAWESQRAPGAPATPAPAETPAEAPAPAAAAVASSAAAVRISAEAGLAFFQTGPDGKYPRGDLRLDEMRIYLEAPVVGNVYFHGELDPETREATDDTTRYGEVYADVEDLPGPWGPGAANLRLGRINVPFGEEYQYRTAIANPLIDHSLSDIWAYDGGVEAYGSAESFSYAAALLMDSISDLGSAHSSRAAAIRIGFDPAKAWGVSASWMRTGRLQSTEKLSALWFGNGFLTFLPGATQFWADLVEGDVHTAWSGGHVRAALGQVRYRDNARAGTNGRNIGYGYVEAVQDVSDQLYAAIRYSRISAPGGYPIVANGTFGEYLFSGAQTTRMERFTAGVGYRFGDPLVLKVNYSPEWGHTVAGDSRDDEQFFATELALKF